MLIVQLHYPEAEGPNQSSSAEIRSNCQSIEMAWDIHGSRWGGVHSGHINIQKSCEGVLCTQEQSCSFKQARSFP